MKKYKGKTNLIFIAQNTIDLIFLRSSSPMKTFLKSRRVERHPYWHNCISSKIACACNLAKNCMRMQFLMHAILLIWVSFNSSNLKECCPRRWAATAEWRITNLWDKDKNGISFVFYWVFHYKLKSAMYIQLTLLLYGWFFMKTSSKSLYTPFIYLINAF